MENVSVRIGKVVLHNFKNVLEGKVTLASDATALGIFQISVHSIIKEVEEE